MHSIINKHIPIVLVFSIICYITITIISILFYTLHQPDIINYAKQSWKMVMSKYVWGMGLWLLMAVIYWYVKCGGYDVQDVEDVGGDRIEGKYVRYWVWVLWKQRILTACIIITLVFVHSSIAINNATAQHASLYYNFKTGKPQHPNHTTTNYDRSWPGWAYYYSDNYYSQTKQRLERTRAKLVDLKQYEEILLALKDAQEGIYAIRSWLANHRFIYDMLRISCGLVGSVVVGLLWTIWACGRVCGKGWAYKGLKVCAFGVLWLLMPLLGVFGQFSHSLVNMNNHPVCQPQPRSAVVVININSISITRISELKLTIIQDPNNIYSNVCYNMQKYHQLPLLTDKLIIKHVLNISMICFVWVFVGQILWMMYSGQISRYWGSTNSNKIGYNSISQNQ